MNLSTIKQEDVKHEMLLGVAKQDYKIQVKTPFHVYTKSLPSESRVLTSQMNLFVASILKSKGAFYTVFNLKMPRS